jgi:hypothetical protein
VGLWALAASRRRGVIVVPETWDWGKTMSGDAKGGSFGSAAVLAMLLLVGASGLYLSQRSLQSHRPDASSMLWREEASPGRADARLWQDPLQAAHRHFEQLRSGESGEPAGSTQPPNETALLDQIRKKTSDGKRDLLIMVFLTTGSTWPSSEGGRIRNRYAMVSALSEAGFIPSDRLHISYIASDVLTTATRSQGRWNDAQPWREQPVVLPVQWFAMIVADHLHSPTDATSRAPVVLPYEWFRNVGEGSQWSRLDDVLVLWLRQDKIQNKQLTTIARLLEEIIPERPAPLSDSIESPGRTKAAILTSGSNDLIEIIVEYETATNADTIDTLKPLNLASIYAYSATISTEKLVAAVEQRLGSKPRGGAGDQAGPSPYQPGRDGIFTLGRRIRHEADRSTFVEEPVTLNVHRTIGTDGELALRLVHELSLRGADPLDCRNQIAFVHEMDTAYARSLPGTFERACEMVRAQRQKRDTRTNGPGDGERADGADAALVSRRTDDSAYAKWPNIHRYTFLQGVDGKLPRSLGNDVGSTEITGHDERESTGSAEEMPIGRGQLDYVRRLVQRLRDDEREWQRARNGRLAAIGVVATDIYDKLPVMQALREAFPDVVFFTTDLYAQMLHPSVYDWMRNTVVASHYDLRLHPTLQRTVPPFRSSYQTSLFLTVMAAVKYPPAQNALARLAADRHAADAARSDGDLAALRELSDRTSRIYEISRIGAYDLAVEREAAIREGSRTVVYPVGRRAVGWSLWLRTRLALIVAIVFGVALVIFGLHSWRPELWSRRGPDSTQGRTANPGDDWSMLFRKRNWAFLFLTLLAFGVFMSIEWCGRQLADAEPFELLAGISMWPSEMIRLITALLAVWCLYVLWDDFRHNVQRMHDDYGLPIDGLERTSRPRAAPGAASHQAGRLAALRHIAHRLLGAWRLPGAWKESARSWFLNSCTIGWVPASSDGTDHIDGMKTWQEYIARARWQNRFWRVLLVLILHAGLILPLFLLFDWPSTPHRGEIIQIVHITFMTLAALGVNLVAFTVWDATRLCDRFTRLVAKRNVEWGEIVAEHVRHRRDVKTITGSSWLTIRIIADRTAAVGRTIYYPFGLIALLMLAWYGRFDTWTLTVPLLLAFALSALVALVALQTLRHSAEDARNSVIERLRDEAHRRRLGHRSGEAAEPAAAALSHDGESPSGPVHARRMADGRGGGDNRRRPLEVLPVDDSDPLERKTSRSGVKTMEMKRSPEVGAADAAPDSKIAREPDADVSLIEQTIAEIRTMRDGAFAPLTENPVIRAVLLPVGGIGAVQLAEFVGPLLG